jgi:mannose-1-phosphate guanylyltransferase
MSINKNIYAVILAGGAGTRFWPVSRRSNPKQFLNITGKGTLLQETLERIKPMASAAHVLIVTNAAYRHEIGRQVSRYGVPRENILLEPSAKNTAPAVCWAAAKIHRDDPDAVMVVLPSDHLILHEKRFLRVLSEAVRLARRDYLVTLGIVPTRPETGYGYLRTAKARAGGRTVVCVERFTEKPSPAKAAQFIRRRNYYWNSGMFVWKSSIILQAFKKHLPQVYNIFVGAGLRPARTGYEIVRKSKVHVGAGFKPARTGHAAVKKVWDNLPSISIDYGILEKAGNVAAVPAPAIGWSDLGSWESLTDVLTADQRGNIFKGDVLPVDCRGTLVWGDKRIIAPVGLENMIIIDTPDALLVCRKDRSQAVKDVVTALQNSKRREI